MLFQGDCHGTSCLAMTTSRAMVRWDSSLSFRMTCKKIYVILSVSEISHDFSEKYMRRQFFGGILHYRSE